MKIQLSTTVLVVLMADALAAFLPPPPTSRRTTSSAIVMEAKSSSSPDPFRGVGNSTADPLSQTKAVPTKKQQDLNTDSFASKMDAELDSLNKEIKKGPSQDSTMAAFDKALQSSAKQSPKKDTAGKGFGAAPAKQQKKKEDVGATLDAALADLKKEEAKVAKKTPHELIQEAKKAKKQQPDVPSVTAKAVKKPLTPAEQMAQVSKNIMEKPKKLEQPKKMVEQPKASTLPPPPKVGEKPIFKKTEETPKKVEIPAAAKKEVIVKKEEPAAVKKTVEETPKKVSIYPESTAAAKKEPEAAAPKKKKVSFEAPNLKIPKIEAPKMPDITVSADWASKVTDTLMESFATIGKGGLELVKEVQSSLNTTMVEDMDITYEEALDKMSSSVQGFVKIVSILGDAVKEVAAEFQKSSNTKKATPVQQKMKEESVQKVIKRASLRIEDAMETMLKEEAEAATTPFEPTVVEEPTKKTSNDQWSSYLDQLNEMKSSLSAKVTSSKPEEEQVVWKENFAEEPEDIPTTTNKKPAFFKDFMSKRERDTMITNVFEQVAAKANMPGDKLKSAMKKFQKEAGSRPVDVEPTPLEEMTSKATSMLDGFKSSASSLAEKAKGGFNNKKPEMQEKPKKKGLQNPFAKFFNKDQ